LTNLLSFITGPMEIGLVWLSLLVGSAGVGIILFTVFVRAVLAPLQITQLRNAKAMQRLQPKMAELKKKHGSDRQKLQEETMSLYREHGVNPAMGCLPMLIQLPILFGLFYALQHLGGAPSGWPHPTWSTVTCNGHPAHTMSAWLAGCYHTANMPGNVQTVFNLFHAHFLWLSNGLGGSDPFFILPVLAGVTQWLQSRMMLQRSSDPQQQMMNTLMNFMPLMIVFFAIRYPSGLALYWVTSTVIGILIQYRITGWGLVPILGSGTIPGIGGSGGSPRPAQSRQTRAARQHGQTSSPASASSTELGPVPTDGGVNGSDGQGSNGSAAPRPRKKANRARGGRSGGRRG
jgi:YidC/Oxa1 family membrane protein insertase